MRILHISTSDTRGGAARGSYGLHQALCEAGVDSLMLVGRKYSDDERVVPLAGATARVHEWVRDSLDQLPLNGYRKTDASFWTVGWVPRGLSRAIEALRPDIVHLHWIGGGFMPIGALRSIPVPVVWTLRDMWAFTGGCHYTAGCTGYRTSCGHCPQLGSTHENDLSRVVWRNKSKAWAGLDLWLVPISDWLAKCAGQSSLFADVPTRVIPNGVDSRRFRPVPPAEARAAWGLAPDKRYILFGAVGALSDERKGFGHLVEAANVLAASHSTAPAELLVFGDIAPDVSPQLGLKTHFLGHIDDDAQLARLYAGADVMVAPSLQEAFGKTLIESMSCGTPVVAFASGGPLDIVAHRENGYLAHPFVATDLANGVAWCLDSPGRTEELGRRARRRVKERFDMGIVVQHYSDLYESILARAA
ncbi:MAG: glycosyltransferase family 4 protein [Rhodospirillales bacterium]|nr:glycosyltransferase family 4 protein [Rhodospirillales bacterium]